MPVSDQRPEYSDIYSKWQLVRDVVHSNAKKYIKDVDRSDVYRNDRYKDDAQLTNFTSKTKSGLLGAVFRKDTIVEVPESIAYVKQDATGFKMSLAKLAQECVGEVLTAGRYGLLVDYPASQDGLTKAEIDDLNLKARIYRYSAESIINWETKIINGNPILNLVVLKECVSYIDPEDGFKWEEKTQYRVLRMVGGEYTQAIYNEDCKLETIYNPRDSQGNNWDFIPFVFIGSEDNDSEIDPIPLYDLAKLNIGHYRNSADYEESIHITGQPTLIFNTSMTPEQFQASNPNGVLIGARRGHNLGENGDAKFLQADPNQLADKAMERKEQQAVMLGARLIVPQADRETAVAANMRHSGETSILATIANNVEHALTQCCEYLLKFMSGEGQESAIKITINNQFFDKTIDPNLIMADIQLIDKGIIAKADLRHKLRQAGEIDENRTDEQLDSEATPLPVQVKPNGFPTNGT